MAGGAISFRGGTGVYFNNTIPIFPNGFENGAVPEIFRVSYVGGAPWTSQCDNIPDRICSDFRSHYDGGDRQACPDYDNPAPYNCVNTCSSDTDCGGRGATCLTKTDGQLDASGWPCRDQTGRGQDDPTTHVQASRLLIGGII